MSEIITRLVNVSKANEDLEFVFTEDEVNWLLNINSKNVSEISDIDVYLLKKIIKNIKGFNIEFEKDRISLSIKK